MSDSEKAMVSVCMVTYKHEKFIAEAIESIVMQETDFVFELLIGEDCGADKTREICTAYQKKYPDIIKLNFRKENVGAQQNFVNTYNLCSGKYVALCEGDDYWTDKNKLQKQVDFLENNSDFVMSCHAASVLTDGKSEELTLSRSELVTKDLLNEDWGIMTASILFKKAAFDVPDWFVKIKNGDFGLQLLLSLKGKIGYMADNMSVYRRHPGGMSSSSLTPFNQAAWVIYLLFEFDNQTQQKYRKLIKGRIKRVYKNQIKFAGEYGLRRAAVKLTFFKQLSLVAPFLIKDYRK